jgi:hypothetical protein
MIGDYAGGHHFQMGAAAEDIQGEMARVQKQQAEQARQRSDYGMQTAAPSVMPAPPPGPPSPLHGVIDVLGSHLNEHGMLLSRLYDRLEQAGVLLPGPPSTEDASLPVMSFRLGQVLSDYTAGVAHMNTALRMLLEQLAL